VFTDLFLTSNATDFCWTRRERFTAMRQIQPTYRSRLAESARGAAVVKRPPRANTGKTSEHDVGSRISPVLRVQGRCSLVGKRAVWWFTSDATNRDLIIMFIRSFTRHRFCTCVFRFDIVCFAVEDCSDRPREHSKRGPTLPVDFGQQ
jgi:hypothetical protein